MKKDYPLLCPALAINAVYQAREGPPSNLRVVLVKELEQLQQLCEKMARSQNKKSAKLGREFLNDWDAIFRVLEHPHMPLTNNFAERLLRHWVILRRITQGTRTPTGSIALTTVASLSKPVVCAMLRPCVICNG